jgi:glyoxylase-like metal-dependent hydrolase (beta-lactamase superfamily II)
MGEVSLDRPSPARMRGTRLVPAPIIAHLPVREIRVAAYRSRAALLLLLSACAAAPTGPAPAAGPYAPLQAVAPGVYVQRGADEAPDALNLGAVGNLGVLVGPTGVVVVNTGSSRAHGEALLERIARLTDRPVLLAIDTQASPDQVLGNAAFSARRIPVLAHRDTAAFMREHCDACVADVKSRADSEALADTPVVWPTRLIEGSQTLSVGGRNLRVLYFGWTRQPGCVAVQDIESGVLFTGDMASFDVIPQAQLGRLDAWIDALRELQAQGPAIVVPGHGPPGPASRLAEVREYLRSLLEATRAAYQRGDGLMESVDSLELASFRRWALYDQYHRRNVHFTYLQIEEQDLKK